MPDGAIFKGRMDGWMPSGWVIWVHYRQKSRTFQFFLNFLNFSNFFKIFYPEKFHPSGSDRFLTLLYKVKVIIIILRIIMIDWQRKKEDRIWSTNYLLTLNSKNFKRKDKLKWIQKLKKIEETQFLNEKEKNKKKCWDLLISVILSNADSANAYGR